MYRENVIYDLAHWLEGQLNQELSIDYIAAKSGYSKWHLQRIFKEVTGLTLANYFRARKLSQAALVIRSSDKPIIDIALDLNFGSPQTFSRAFKKRFGKSPISYRYCPDAHLTGFCSPLSV